MRGFFILLVCLLCIDILLMLQNLVRAGAAEQLLCNPHKTAIYFLAFLKVKFGLCLFCMVKISNNK